VSDRESNGGGEGLSVETLLIAAVASAVAAVVVSRFWQGGTPIAAAVTPVIVSLVSEGLRRPMRSDRVRSTTRRAIDPLRRTRPGSVPVERKVGEEELGYRVYGAEGKELSRAGEGPGPVQRGRELLERIRMGLTPKRTRIALVTGLLAFVAAAAVVTLPELLFGGSVSGDRDTTFFGGDDGERDKDKEGERDGGGAGGGDGGSEGSPGSEPSDGAQPGESEPPPSESPPPEEQPPPEPAPTPPPPVP
jgi:hypothetical protein